MEINRPDKTIELLKKRYNLHVSSEVAAAANRSTLRTGVKVPQNPLIRIETYLHRIQKIVGGETHERRERGVNLLKGMLHSKHVIKPNEVPESYWDNQRRILRERGQEGDLPYIDWEELKRQNTEAIIADQKSSLDKWVDYLSSDDALYPDALKYWTMRNVLNMSPYDKEKEHFAQRSWGTTKPFPDLNREALAYVLDSLSKKYSGGNTNVDPEFGKLLQAENFGKLYAWAIEKVTPANAEGLANIRGEWVKYEQGSDHMPLVQSIQGHGTGWCTAGESTAEVQLQGGDFYVYYSNDKNGNASVPRVAIRMESNKIAEVRGIAPEQNLDPYIAPIVEQKLTEFPDGKEYQQKVSDMKQLTEIDYRLQAGQQLNMEDLRFLYEIDHPIIGFGYSKDPRINEILSGRDPKTDLSQIFNCSPNEISLTNEEALRGNIKYHYGDLNRRSLTSAEGLTLPQTIGRSLYLDSLTSAEGITLPQNIGGDLYLGSLTSAEGLTLPQTVDGDLYLGSLTSAEGLTLPQTIGRSLYLDSLTSAEGITLPQTMGGDLDLRSLTSAEGLTLPQTVDGIIYLNNLNPTEKEKLRQLHPYIEIF